MEKEILEHKKQLLYDVITNKSYRPMKFRELSGLLQVPKNERDDLKLVLDSLISDGKIMLDGNARYKVMNGNIKVGIFSGTTRGFGFVTIEGEEDSGDVFIPESETKGALNKDKVQIMIQEEQQSGKRREGAVIAIIERNVSEIVGTFQKSKNFGFVIPDNQRFGADIFIPKEKTKGAVNGHKVLVEITDYGSETKNPEGKIVQIIGHINDPGVDIASVILSNGLPTEFPEEVMKQVERVEDEIDPKEIGGRLDLRSWQTVTIDGEDAKDLDDAITISREGNGYKLGVHIADVSNYVTEGSPLDKEALKRGTSVYLVDRVIPMLPHKLSNGICSLNAGCDRLALSCIMEIDHKGNVTGHRIAETVINVDRRMSYTSVNKIVEERDEEEMKEYEGFVEMFDLMQELAVILREKRRKRGSIDFDFPESKIIMNEEGKPVDIKPYERNKATRIIEDFMLIANETVAEDFFWQELPFVYRSHENPDLEKIQKLSIFINNFGYTMHIGQDEIHPKELQKLLVKIEGTPEEALISRLTLRSMKQAKYTTTCDGHFGLSTKYYCHFTSPIRRYPDLQIHRIIKENLRGGMREKRIVHYDRILPDVAKQASLTERRADEAEREVEKLKKVEYMSQFIGQTFEGVISGVTAWGMYVELPNTVEGMIRMADMHDDYFIYDEEHYQLVGEHTRKTYKLGQSVIVRVEDTDRLLKTIDFSIVKTVVHEVDDQDEE
ncbi:MAG: ribonuclease R [Clostridiales bacterium]|nr:ribonuclease R [Clostridiales bacterium]